MEITWSNIRIIGEIISISFNIYLSFKKNKEKKEKNSFIREQRREEKLKLRKKDREIKSLKKEIEDLLPYKKLVSAF